jgi:hypothetical protein
MGLVAIHDGVRPFVSLQPLGHSFEVAQREGCAIAVVPLKDSIRRVSANGSSQSADRAGFRLVQTPQTFKLPVIKKSFAVASHTHFTDDASVAEAAGFPISLIEGSYENIKITTPEDILWAEAFVKNKYGSNTIENKELWMKEYLLSNSNRLLLPIFLILIIQYAAVLPLHQWAPAWELVVERLSIYPSIAYRLCKSWVMQSTVFW